jgi:acyl-CoA thioesterase-2
MTLESPGSPSEQLSDQIRRLVTLEQLRPDLFRAEPLNPKRFRVFGGQPLAQGLLAGHRTIEADRRIHSLHAYFVHAGDATLPIDYAVQKLRDGRSFSTVRIEARQGERVIFEMLASFQPLEHGLEHQLTMPAGVPGPDDVAGWPTQADVSDSVQVTGLGLDLRTVEDPDRPSKPGRRISPEKATIQTWFRTRERLPDDHIVHAAVLAYASDMMLLRTAGAPQGLSLGEPNLQVASIDHALWFHRDFRADEWLLHDVISPSLSGSRALTQGRVYGQDGTLVATTTQEGLVRRRD